MCGHWNPEYMYLVYRRIQDLCIGYILSENIVCKLFCCFLVLLSGFIFGQARVRPKYGTVLIVVHVYPLVPGCDVEREWDNVVARFQVRLGKFAKSGIFRNFDSI